MSLVVLDTDAASSLFRQRPAVALQGVLRERRPAITFVTVGELTKWTLARRWGPRRRAEMSTLLAYLILLPYEQEVAHRWGELQAFAQLRGRPRPVNDSWIAACCLARELPLATLNLRDYEDFADHEGLDLLPAG